MQRSVPLGFALVLVAGWFLVLLPGAQAGELLSARLLKVDTAYDQETWKYNTAYEGPASTAQMVGHLQNRTATYYGALGLRVTFKIQIFDTQNPEREVRDSAYNLSAYIPTSKGSLYAYVQRDRSAAPGPSDSPVFWLVFDLDGTNNGDPLGRYPPAAEPGFRSVRVDITKRQQDVPPTRPVGSAEFYFTYEIPSVNVRIPNFAALPYLQIVPDGVFRLYNDIGWGQSVLFVARSLPPAESVQVEYQFSGPNLHVRLIGLLGERGAAAGDNTAPAGAPSVPFIPGVSDNKTLQNQLNAGDALTIVSKKQLGEATTGDDGRVVFTVTGDDLLKVRRTPLAGSLVVLAPLLDPGLPDTPDPANYAGGSHIRVGATELVVPISDKRAVIERYRLLESSGGAQNVSDPARNYALAVNGLQVDVRDVDGFLNPPQPRSGDLVAIVPDVRNTAALSGAGLAPTQSETNLLRGTLSVRPIQEQGVSTYRILALLYREQDIYYGMTYGDRGYLLESSATPAPLGTPSYLFVNFTSRTTNYDLLTNEKDFELKVFLRVRVADLKYNQSTSILLPEGAQHTIVLPFTSPRAAEVRTDVTTSSGDVTPRDLRVNLNFFEPPPKKSLADRLPGFELPLLVAALALGLALLRRR